MPLRSNIQQYSDLCSCSRDLVGQCILIFILWSHKLTLLRGSIPVSIFQSTYVHQLYWNAHFKCIFPWQWASYQIRKIAGCACAGNAGNVFPRRRFQRKPLVSDPGMHHGTCVTHVPWCMSGSLVCGDGENVPGIPGACASASLRIWQEAHGGHHFLSRHPQRCCHVITYSMITALDQVTKQILCLAICG